MARNNPKPTGKVDWPATGNIVEPNAGRKTSGWLFDVKPPAQNFNWFWNLLGLNQFYSNAQVEDWIVIDSDPDEGDYATLVAYLADAPAPNQRILVKEDQTITAQVVMQPNTTLKFRDGALLLSATDIATSVIKFGSGNIIEGVLNVVLSHTGTTAKAVEFDGDATVGKIHVNNSSTGTLTTAYHINANKTGNRINGLAQNTGGGVLTNVGIDNSTEDSNIIEIVDEPNNQIWRSRGAYKFREGLEFDLGSDANGDIYYRDAGILKRLAKGADDTWLKLASGIPSWSNVGKFLGGLSFNLGSDADGDIYYREAGILKRRAKGANDTYLKLVGGIPSWSNVGKFLGGLSFNLGSDADGDTYYRDAGILKRLAKATDRDILTLISGLPSWVTPDGSYTPTPTNVSNWASGTARPAFWTRAGNIVTVSGLITEPVFSSASIRTRVRLDLPVASNLAAQWDLAGSGTNEDAITGADAISIVGDFANDEAILTFWPQSTGGAINTLSYEYSYEVI